MLRCRCRLDTAVVIDGEDLHAGAVDSAPAFAQRVEAVLPTGGGSQDVNQRAERRRVESAHLHSTGCRTRA